MIGLRRWVDGKCGGCCDEDVKFCALKLYHTQVSLLDLTLSLFIILSLVEHFTSVFANPSCKI